MSSEGDHHQHLDSEAHNVTDEIMLMSQGGSNPDVNEGQQLLPTGNSTWEQQFSVLVQSFQHYSREQLISFILRLIVSVPAETDLVEKAPEPITTPKRRRASSGSVELSEDLIEVEGRGSSLATEGIHPMLNNSSTARFYNWAKYGNKLISPKPLKTGEGEVPESPSSKCRKEYFKCTSPGCTAKRSVLHTPGDGKTEEFDGFHNHTPPTRARVTKELREQLIERIQNGESPADLYKLIDAENIGLSKRALYNLKYTRNTPKGEKKRRASAGDEVSQSSGDGSEVPQSHSGLDSFEQVVQDASDSM